MTKIIFFKMRKTVSLLIFFLGLTLFIYLTNSQIIKLLLLAGVIFPAVYSKRINQFLVFSGVSVVFSTFSNPILWLIPCIPLFINEKVYHLCIKYGKFFIPFLLLSLASFMFGQKSELNTMIVFYMAILIFIQAIDYKVSSRELFIYSLFSFSILFFILLFNVIRNGGVELKFGRLALDGSIRTVANIAALPAFLSWSLLLQKEASVKRYLLIVVGVLSSSILVLTISKGAIIAVLLGILATSFFSINRKGFIYLFLIIGLLYFFFNGFIFTLEDYHFYRLTDEFDGFSGRTDIWNVFYKHFASSFTTVLFGFGPGDIKRFAFADDTYAHSLFLDMMLSYGIMMVILFGVVLVKLIKSVFTSKYAISIGLLVFTILLYATHGSVTTSTFYIYLGTAYAMCNGSFFYKELKNYHK